MTGRAGSGGAGRRAGSGSGTRPPSLVRAVLDPSPGDDALYVLTAPRTLPDRAYQHKSGGGYRSVTSHENGWFGVAGDTVAAGKARPGRRRRPEIALVLVLAALLVSSSPAAAKPPAWTPGQAAAALVAADPRLPVPVQLNPNEPPRPVPYGHFQTATCKVASAKLALFRCTATYAAGIRDRAEASVWVRVRQYGAGSVCASLRKPVPAGCVSAADGARADGDATTEFRRWLQPGGGLAQGVFECVGYGSGFYRCVRPSEPPVRATVVFGANGVKVTRMP